MLIPPIEYRVKERILKKQIMDSYAAVEIEVKSNLGDFDPRIGMEARMHKIKAYTAHTIIALDGIPLRGYV